MDSRRKSACNSPFVSWRLGEGRARAARARRGANRSWPIRPKPGETGRQSTVIACLQARVRIRQKIWVQQNRNLQIIRAELAHVKLGRNFTSLHQHFQERVQRLRPARVRTPAHLKCRGNLFPKPACSKHFLHFGKSIIYSPMHPAFLLQLTALSELVRNPDPSIEFACYCSLTVAGSPDFCYGSCAIVKICLASRCYR
jgi:hypothetical protein